MKSCVCACVGGLGGGGGGEKDQGVTSLGEETDSGKNRPVTPVFRENKA